MGDAELVQAKQERNSASKRAADWEAACYRINSDNARLRAQLEAVEKELAIARRVVFRCAPDIVDSLKADLAAFSNEGGEDG